MSWRAADLLPVRLSAYWWPSFSAFSSCAGRALERRRPCAAASAVSCCSAVGRLSEPRLLASSVYQDGHWHLLAGGERRPTVAVNGAFAGAWLPAGEQRIDLLYRPRIFVAGCLLAALALAAAAAWWVPRPMAAPRLRFTAPSSAAERV